MTAFQKGVLAFLSIVVVAICGLVIWLYSGAWQRPLGPSLKIATATEFQMPPTWTPSSSGNAALPSTPEIFPLSPASSTLTSQPLTGVCGAPPVMNVLAIGTDARGENYNYGLADVIRLVRVDFVNPRITILEIPRDLWVEIPDIADNLDGQDHEKLNQAYLYGNRGFGYTNDPAQGPGLLARTLMLNFGTDIDHYVAVNMKTFVKIVNAVGGIDVYLPDGVDGRTADDTSERLVFDAGTHHLNGDRSLTLARIRIEGTFARADNQNRVLCALRDKLTSPDVVTRIPELIQSFQGSIQTDMSPAQLSQLACIGTQLQPGNIVFASFPEELFSQGRQLDPVFGKTVFVWDVDFNILREYITKFNEGTWPLPGGMTFNSNKEEIPFCP